MKIIKFIFSFLLVLVLAIVVIGLILPSSARIERSVEIDRPPGVVFSIINNLGRFPEWSPWHDIDPATEYQFNGPARGVGSKMTWISEHPHVGSGSQQIIESDSNRKIEVELDFGHSGKNMAEILIDSTDGNTSKVTWVMHSDAGGNIIGRYFNLMLDSMLGPMYEKGLAKLKALAESGADSSQDSSSG